MQLSPKTLFLSTAVLIGSFTTATETTQTKDEFDCVALFDFVTAIAAPNCPSNQRNEPDTTRILAAEKLLLQHNLLDKSVLAGVSKKFCALTHGLGLVRQSNEILLDDGLRLGSPETLAEVIAHEIEHVEQMRKMGEDEFKCAYVEELLACGCMDKHHALEAPAYARQAGVRELLLKQWLDR